MPYFEVDVERTSFGVIRIKAENGQEAMKIVQECQPMIEEDALFADLAVKAISAEPSYG